MADTILTACTSCGDMPCSGTTLRCDVDLYAAHRGLTVEQLLQQQRFAERRNRADVQRAIGRLFAGQPD